LWKRGEVFRTMGDAELSIKSDAVYGAYGTGSSPEWWSSWNLSSTTNWTNANATCTNCWNATIIKEVGAVIVNGTTNSGLRQYGSIATLNVQGEFVYNASVYGTKLILYSVSNPASYYSSIEASSTNKTSDSAMALSSGSDRWVMANLTFKYGCRHGISTSPSVDNVSIYNMRMEWIGGCVNPGDDTPYGNAIQLHLTTRNATIYNNTVFHAYDACITSQSELSGGITVMNKNLFMHNICDYTSYPLELFSSNSSSTLTNINITQNTFLHTGKNAFGKNSGQIRMSGSPHNTHNITFTNNLIDDTDSSFIRFDENTWNGDVPTWDYNLYYNRSTADNFYYNGTTYGNLSAWQAGTGQDAHSLLANPLLTGYIPAYNSPACNMSSTGGYVGALPCEAAPEPPVNPTPDSSGVCSSTDTALLGLISFICMIAVILALFNMDDPLKVLIGAIVVVIFIPIIISIVGGC
jgi:hypothetical protein